MCLITKQKVATIITEDMVVCKFLSAMADHYIPPFYHFEYTPGELYKTEIHFSYKYRFFDNERDLIVPVDVSYEGDYLRNEGYVSIGKGFHSIRLDKVSNYNSDGCAHCKCIIPAGSEVFTNEDTGLIVSNQIIVVGRLD